MTAPLPAGGTPAAVAVAGATGRLQLDEAEPPARILVVSAHPDDVDFGAAGSVATWVQRGATVAYCVVTDGAAGGFDLSVSRAEMAATRQREQQAAAAAVGVDDVTFLGHPDGRLAATVELRRDLSAAIRRFRPDRVLCQSPERLWDRLGASHPDHLAAGEATVAAVYPDARNPFAHPELLTEGLQPHTVTELWLMAGRDPNRVVDVTDAVDRKLAALRSHHSQHPDPDAMEGWVRGWMRATAESAGLPEGRLAEVFQVVSAG